ncbi:rhodopsin [Hydra vulgaris]|uniref:Rhodopsin n=1 Tax=Hydra vulgaris TaxID=6087 RepID=A0ABM4BLK0_HYDVU
MFNTSKIKQFENISSVSDSQVVSFIPTSVQITINIFILVFAFFGNSFVVLFVLKTKKKALSNRIIMNLAICDLTLVFSSIPLHIVELYLGYFPLGKIGCHTIHPLSTMAVISGSLTLVFLAIERFVAICFPFMYFRIANRSHYLLLTHLSALCCVIPYSATLKISVVEGKPQCSESWSRTSSLTYTVFLFAVQYGVPLPIICFLYFIMWFKLKATNDESVRRSRITSSQQITYNKRDIKIDKKKGHKKSIKKRISNKIYQDILKSRKKQTLSMFRLFMTLVIVFATFMLPNQITWLYMVFSKNPVHNKIWQIIAYWLTYTNAVINPLIYGTNQKYHLFLKKLIYRYKESQKANEKTRSQITIVQSGEVILQRNNALE